MKRIKPKLKKTAIFVLTCSSPCNDFISLPKFCIALSIYVKIDVRKKIVGDGNIDGIPIVSRRDSLILFGKIKPGRQNPCKVFSPAPTGAIPPIIMERTLWDNMTSNMVRRRMPYDLVILIPAKMAVPRISPSGRRRSDSMPTGRMFRLNVPFIIS